VFDKIITFSADPKYVNLKECYPEPIKLNIPEWFKKLEHAPDKLTVKGCMPFLETLTSGYLLKLPLEFHLRHNVLNKNGERESHFNTVTNVIDGVNLNYNKDTYHPPIQLKGSPLVKKNLDFSIYKIHNPWRIQTPPGYSCLFIPPLNNSDDRFSIVPAIVHTDKYKLEINFPFTVNGDKYPILDTVLKKGTPYVQVIPFKRDSWKMQIKSKEENLILNWNWTFNLFRVYQSKIWEKIKWK